MGQDGSIIAFLLLSIDAIIEDASVFLYVDFVSEPIGEGSVALVFRSI